MHTTKKQGAAGIYNTLYEAYGILNGRLYEGQLPECVITLVRGKRFYGYFRGNSFKSKTDERCDEIAMNPDYLTTVSEKDVFSTLAHEMAHLWQHHFGKPSRNAYHNKEWAKEMLRIGLKPFNVNNPEKMTGQFCSHTIIENGLYHFCYDIHLVRLSLDWGSLPDAPKAKGKSGKRKKFTCPACGMNAWAKEGANIGCWECWERMIDEDEDSEMGDDE